MGHLHTRIHQSILHRYVKAVISARTQTLMADRISLCDHLPHHLTFPGPHLRTVLGDLFKLVCHPHRKRQRRTVLSQSTEASFRRTLPYGVQSHGTARPHKKLARRSCMYRAGMPYGSYHTNDCCVPSLGPQSVQSVAHIFTNIHRTHVTPRFCKVLHFRAQGTHIRFSHQNSQRRFWDWFK